MTEGAAGALFVFALLLVSVFGIGWMAGAAFTLWAQRRSPEGHANGRTGPHRGNHNRAAKSRARGR